MKSDDIIVDEGDLGMFIIQRSPFSKVAIYKVYFHKGVKLSEAEGHEDLRKLPTQGGETKH